MKYALTLLASTMAGLLFAAEPAKDTLISHRGESIDAPENTLPAYKTAVARGFGFECDVYLSADGRIFTFHDGNLTRTTAGACKKQCAEATWDEISRLDVGGWGKWKGSKFSPTRPALLEEVLALAKDGRWIYVEVKPGPAIVPAIKRIFAAQKIATPKNTLFISFDKASCKALKEQMPEYKVLWLTGATYRAKKGGTRKTPVTAEKIVATLKSMKVDGVDCQFDPRYTTAELIAKVKAAGYEFHVWTIDKLALTRLAFSRGAQTVTTNCAQDQFDEYVKVKNDR